VPAASWARSREAAVAAVLPADAVERRRALQVSYLTAFPGYYETADAGYMDEDGYLYIMARTDDIINVAGHRLSTGGMEEVLASHPDVAECAVVGIADKLKGQIPIGFVVLKSGVNKTPEEVEAECVKLVRDKIGPVAAFKLAVVVDRLPKTRSGKILRGTMVKIADGETSRCLPPSTIPRSSTRFGQGLSPGSALRLAGRRIRLPGNQEPKDGPARACRMI
jgi:acyl-coenzyme A synthetase/AMP-(fatty) acid ligase